MDALEICFRLTVLVFFVFISGYTTRHVES